MAIDPGVTTGFSINFPTKSGLLGNSWQVRYLDFEKPHQLFSRHLMIINPEVIVCEAFNFRQGQEGLDNTPGELIGIVHLYGDTKDKPIIMQNSSVKSKKGFWTDNKLKHLGLYVPNAPHAMDATRHRLHFEESMGLINLNLLRGV